MRETGCLSNPFLAASADNAVRDWLETQSQVTRYWRDVLVSSGGSDALISALDDHASFLRAAAHAGEGDSLLAQ